MQDDQVIEVNNVSMCFNMNREKILSLKEYLIKLFKNELRFEEFWSLQDISFSINRGEIFGIIGLNGAGKSTLLKIIAGIIKPTKGEVNIRGSIAPLIELGAGFDLELTARENIYLNGAILGYSKDFINSKFDEIVEFAELNDFIDVPIKNFSSGMTARLGFSIATLVNPDILIVDEILSVGDYKFQEKCYDRINNMVKKGTTILLVSHAIDLIKKMCTNVLWLDHGKIKGIGHAKDVIIEFEHY
jgi:ABC-2 type transport system ATP-binding protein/lipopolysaccharide transport system ATP-binding protein